MQFNSHRATVERTPDLIHVQPDAARWLREQHGSPRSVLSLKSIIIAIGGGRRGIDLEYGVPPTVVQMACANTKPSQRVLVAVAGDGEVGDERAVWTSRGVEEKLIWQGRGLLLVFYERMLWCRQNSEEQSSLEVD